MIAAIEMKDEIEEEIDAVDSDISTTLGLLDQQKAALLFPDNDFIKSKLCKQTIYDRSIIVLKK